MSLLAHLERAPGDPILGLTEAGVVPLLDCVAAADQRIIAAGKPYGHLPIDGLTAYDEAVADLVLGDNVERDRVAVVQSLGEPELRRQWEGELAGMREHAVSGLDSGRICVAALNGNNLPYVISAIGAVL